MTKLITTSDFGCKDSLTKNVYIRPNSLSNFSINDSDQCFKGNRFVFTNNSTISSGTFNNFWNFGDNSSSYSSSPTHSYHVTDKTYYVKLVTISGYGCKDSMMKKVIIYPQPVANFSVNDNDQCFKGNNFVFSNTSSISSGTFNNLWNFGDNNTSTLSNPAHSYSIFNSIYNVRLVATSLFGCSDSVNKTMILYSSPIDSFKITYGQHGNVTFNPYAGSGNSYKWYFGDGDSSFQQNPTHKYKSNKSYTVTVNITNSYNCTEIGKHTVIVKNATGIDNMLNSSDISVYPNPASDLLYIDIPKEDFNTTATIYSSDGKQIIVSNLKFEHNSITLNNMAKGVYLLIIRGDNELFRTKIVKL